MALWYFGILLFSVFSGLYYIYGPDRAVTPNTVQENYAGIFDACREAAVAYAIITPTAGATAGAPFNSTCQEAALGGAANPRVTGLNAPAINITIRLASDIVPGALGRTIVAYLPKDTALVATGVTGDATRTAQMTAAQFADVKTQLMSISGNDINTGIVVANNGTSNKITQYTADLVAVPQNVGIGALAVVTNVQP